MNWITTLFLRFNAIWGHKWFSSIPDEEHLKIAINEWGTALYGIRGEAIAQGVEHCKKNLEWPPSIAQFIKICDKQCGIPGVEEAYYLAQQKDLSHPLVQLVYQGLGDRIWDFKMKDEKTSMKIFKSVYKEVIKEYRHRESEKNLLIHEK